MFVTLGIKSHFFICIKRDLINRKNPELGCIKAIFVVVVVLW